MKVVVLGGAGKVSLGAIQDFVENKEVEKLLLADIDRQALEKRQAFLNANKVEIVQADLNDHQALVALLNEYDVCLNGSSHHFNLKVMKACLEAKTNYTDFGGLYHWAKEQLTMHDEFVKAGITGIVGSGSAPGIVNVMAKYAYENLDTVESVNIRDAIVNFNMGKNDFVPPYAIETLLDEYMMNSFEFKNGEFIENPPFSGAETITFPEPIGKQTVINVIHSEVATMPNSFKDKGIQNVSFKLGLPHFFEENLRFLVGLGFGRTEPIDVRGTKVTPRQVLAEIVKQKDSEKPPEHVKHDDHKLLRVEVKGTKNGKTATYVIDTMLSPYEEWPHMSQGVFSVGFPAAVTTRLLGGAIQEKGFFASEQVIPTELYFNELAKRGIRIEANFIQEVSSNLEVVNQ